MDKLLRFKILRRCRVGGKGGAWPVPGAGSRPAQPRPGALVPGQKDVHEKVLIECWGPCVHTCICRWSPCTLLIPLRSILPEAHGEVLFRTDRCVNRYSHTSEHSSTGHKGRKMQQLKYLSMGEWINKMRSIHTMAY